MFNLNNLLTLILKPFLSGIFIITKKGAKRINVNNENLEDIELNVLHITKRQYELNRFALNIMISKVEKKILMKELLKKMRKG